MSEYRRIIRDCPVCGRKRRMLASHHAWMGWCIVCTGCAQGWGDGGCALMPPRSEERADEVRRMKALWKAASQ